MEVEFTARQVKISKALREQAEEGMERIARILGKTARASITFGAQRHLQIVELTVQVRTQTIAATGKADTLDAALKEAIEHAVNQARRYRDRRLDGKRLPKEEKVLTAPPVARPKARAAAASRGSGGGQACTAQGAGIHRGPLVSQPRDGGRAAHSQERGSHFAEADDHRGGSERYRVSRPGSADFPQSRRR